MSGVEMLAATEIPLDELRPAEWNANRVSAATLKKVRRSIETFGFVENLVARPHPDGIGFEVLSGNHRLELLREYGAEAAPVVIVLVDDADARILAQTLNRTRGADDPAAYAALLERVLADVGAERIAAFLPETESSIDRILTRFRGAPAMDDAPPLPAEPRSKPGEVYELGPHRLVCGDATDQAVAGAALDGGVDCVVTDPPYGVDYGEKSGRPIAGDALRGLDLEQLVQAALGWPAGAARSGTPIYVWYSHAQEALFKMALANAGWRYAQTLVWVKSSQVLGRSDYHYRHEPVLYGWKPGKGGHRWYGDRGETTVLDDEIDPRTLSKTELVRLVEQLQTRAGDDVLRAAKPASSELHPTQKPVWLLAHFLLNSTERGGRVYDPFAGSGSTLVAAEQTGRVARLVEIDPGYCDVIRDRYTRIADGA